MRVFVVVGYLQPEFAAVEAALERLYPNATYKAREGLWFLRSEDPTSKEVSDRLGFTGASSVTNGMVVGINGYFGKWRTDIWEWLRTTPGGLDA